MYCPTCGKSNGSELKFCAACGTNLEAVSQALTGREEDFFTKMDAGIDQLVGRYTEHVFRDAPQYANDRKVSSSWRLLGQAVLTTLLDLLLFVLMWNLLPLRLLILVISTPFRLMSEHDKSLQLPDHVDSEFGESRKRLWSNESVESISEHTTTLLEVIPAAGAATTDRLTENSRSKQ
jgi:hypothetical protein